jgi:hypothetical protein
LVLLPGLLSLVFLLLRKKIIKLSPLFKTTLLFIQGMFFCIYNYIFIGKLDQLVNFRKLDFFLAQFDLLIFDMPVAEFIGGSFPFNTSWGFFLNDILIFNYILFYFLGLYAIFGYYLSLKKKKYRVGITILSFFIFMGLNHLFYMLIPVSGPQYFQKDYFTEQLKFSLMGQFWFNVVLAGQKNLIDCFPSGHFGVALMATLWAYKINRVHFYIMIFVAFCVFLATLRLRFHYTLDLIFSPFLVILSYLLARKLFLNKYVDFSSDTHR